MGRIFFQKPFFRKFNTNLANISQNRGKFLIFGKCMGPILGQNLVNVWVSFQFPSGTSLPKKVSTPSPPRELVVHHQNLIMSITWIIDQRCGCYDFCCEDMAYKGYDPLATTCPSLPSVPLPRCQSNHPHQLSYLAFVYWNMVHSNRATLYFAGPLWLSCQVISLWSSWRASMTPSLSRTRRRSVCRYSVLESGRKCKEGFDEWDV